MLLNDDAVCLVPGAVVMLFCVISAAAAAAAAADAAIVLFWSRCKAHTAVVLWQR